MTITHETFRTTFTRGRFVKHLREEARDLEAIASSWGSSAEESIALVDEVRRMAFAAAVDVLSTCPAVDACRYYRTPDVVALSVAPGFDVFDLESAVAASINAYLVAANEALNVLDPFA